jgi:hypothetical protein
MLFTPDDPGSELRTGSVIMELQELSNPAGPNPSAADDFRGTDTKTLVNEARRKNPTHLGGQRMGRMLRSLQVGSISGGDYAIDETKAVGSGSPMHGKGRKATTHVRSEDSAYKDYVDKFLKHTSNLRRCEEPLGDDRADWIKEETGTWVNTKSVLYKIDYNGRDKMLANCGNPNAVKTGAVKLRRCGVAGKDIDYETLRAYLDNGGDPLDMSNDDWPIAHMANSYCCCFNGSVEIIQMMFADWNDKYSGATAVDGEKADDGYIQWPFLLKLSGLGQTGLFQTAQYGE